MYQIKVADLKEDVISCTSVLYDESLEKIYNVWSDLHVK
jgi:hypothetical protein